MRAARQTAAFLDVARAIALRDAADVRARLDADPTLATGASVDGAKRSDARAFFLEEISHYVYAGDTALHIAAAAFDRRIAKLLVDRGADCRARTRQGAEPLHYAADTNHW